MKRLIRISILCLAAIFGSATSFVIAADDQVEVVAAESVAQSVEGGIRLSASGREGFEIYSITGQKVKAVAVEDSSVKVELPKGCYIVRTAKWSKKVVVR